VTYTRLEPGISQTDNRFGSPVQQTAASSEGSKAKQLT
jgi:hypothetical protein